MIGVWSGGGLGSANAYASLALHTLPFALYTYRTARTPRNRLLAYMLAGVSIFSILFSGTRGALLVVVLLAGGLAISLRSRKAIRIFAVIGLAMIANNFLPSQYYERYRTFFPNESPAGTTAERIARDSAQARITGLTDGLKLFALEPVLGVGPGASSAARRTFHTEATEPMEQLHNLYGQVASESGAIGIAAWVVLLVTCFRRGGALRVPTRIKSPEDDFDSQRLLVGWLLIAMLAYGMVSHTLYDEKWMLLVGIASVNARLRFVRQSRGIQPKRRQPALKIDQRFRAYWRFLNPSLSSSVLMMSQRWRNRTRGAVDMIASREKLPGPLNDKFAVEINETR